MQWTFTSVMNRRLSRDLDFEDADAEGKWKTLLETGGRGKFDFQRRKSSSGVTWKAEAVSDKLGDRSEISKESVKGAAWCLLYTYKKKCKRKELKKKKKEPESQDLKSSEPL